MTPTGMAEIFSQTGPTIALVIVLMYWVFFLQRKLISIIENNTKAMTKSTEVLEGMKDTIRDCQHEHRRHA